MMKLSRATDTTTASGGLIQQELTSAVSENGRVSAGNTVKNNVSMQTGEEFSLLFLQNRVQSLEKGVESDSKDSLVKEHSSLTHKPLASEVLGGSQSAEMKFLCSFGGKFLPRPGDAKLRYVGVDTRIISICKNISWQELMKNEPLTIKYQLPTSFTQITNTLRAMSACKAATLLKLTETRNIVV